MPRYFYLLLLLFLLAFCVNISCFIVHQPVGDAGYLAEYVILDFTDVRRIDSTAARSCFYMFTNLMRELHTIELIFAGLPESTLEILKNNAVIYDGDTTVHSLNDALYHCEEKLLKKHRETTHTNEYIIHSSTEREMSHKIWEGGPDYFSVSKRPTLEVL